MAEPLENLYFNWLYAKVCDVRATTPSRRFETLLGELHRIEFVWLISGDDNRAEDGCDLRVQFLTEARLGIRHDDPFLIQTCSILEMLVALSERCAFESDETKSYWFWVMMENLGISELHDGLYITTNVISSVVEKFVFRTYLRGGQGGLFPLMRTRNDQRKVEIWYQFSEYMYEHDLG